MEPALPTPAAHPGGNAIQLKLREISQLFNSLDPSPFNEKDLDHDAEEFIVSWAREISHHGRLRLVIHLERPPPPGQGEDFVCESVRHYFAYRASINGLELRDLLKRGRTSLLIGCCFLAVCLALSQVFGHRAGTGVFGSAVRESLSIAGWVAMWRPMEIYLYDWWPLRRRGRLLRQLSHISVELKVPQERAPGPGPKAPAP